jgi:GGDEF domain-containing protein
MPLPDPLLEHVPLFLGLALVITLLGLGALRLARRRATLAAGPVLPAMPLSVLPPAATATSLPTQRICAAFQEWLTARQSSPSLSRSRSTWASFDQLVRETLGEHLGATRVRCYHVQPDCATLQPISNTGRAPTAGAPSAHEGLLGHVATTGREFADDDAAHGPLVDDLAAATDEAWTWIWPVRDGNATIGLIAVGQLNDAALELQYAAKSNFALQRDLRQSVGPLLSLCWQHVTSLERLHLVRRTDRASGVLTRNDFFDLAGQALDDSYSNNEPVVLAVLALEGLRRLDDTHCWGERDELIERLGQAIADRTRSDDLVGRFADDRFVVLLRRLDSGLGRLIAEKMLASANDCITELGRAGTRPGPGPDQPAPPALVRLRAGLAGSGLARPPLRELLGNAMDAVEHARKAGVAIGTDLPPAAGGGPQPEKGR